MLFSHILHIIKFSFVLDLLAHLNSVNGSAASSTEDKSGASSASATPNGSTAAEAGPSGAENESTTRHRRPRPETAVEKDYTQDQLEAVRK